MDIRETLIEPLTLENINPLNDVLFKFIFGKEERKSITISFLNAVLQESLGHEIADITYKQTEMVPLHVGDKLSRIDIACELDTGELVDVEVQVINQQNMARRTLFYWAQMYLSALPEGYDYSRLKPAITINLLNFSLIDDEAGADEPHSMYGIYNIRTGHRLNRDLELHFLELPKFIAVAKKPVGEMSRMERWLSYFANRLTDIERSELAMSDTAIAGAMNATRVFMSTTAERLAYINRQMEIMDARALKDSSRAEGLAEGRAEGRTEGQGLERLANLKNIVEKLAYSPDEAMDLLNVPAEERDYYRQALKA